MGFTGLAGGCHILVVNLLMITDAIPVGRNTYARESKKVCKFEALLAWGLQLVDHATAMLSERHAELQVPLVLQS